MSGVTDVAFRALSRKYGAALTYTEFVNSTGIVRGNVKALDLLKTDPIEKPVAVQLFGNSIPDVIEAAQFCEEKFDIIDVNCGCPAWKVVKTGAGSALLNNPGKIATVINKLVSAVTVPVTVKIRAGVDERNVNAVEVARVAEDAGAAAVAVHGRTQRQGYRGVADWNVIREVKEAVNIPVIGNGDVFTPEQFKEKLECSGVDAIMVARGAIGNPFVFRQIEEFLETGAYEQPDWTTLFREYLALAQRHGIEPSCIKNQAVSFTKGVEGGARVRERLVKCRSVEEISTVLAKC